MQTLMHKFQTGWDSGHDHLHDFENSLIGQTSRFWEPDTPVVFWHAPAHLTCRWQCLAWRVGGQRPRIKRWHDGWCACLASLHGADQIDVQAALRRLRFYAALHRLRVETTCLIPSLHRCEHTQSWSVHRVANPDSGHRSRHRRNQFVYSYVFCSDLWSVKHGYRCVLRFLLWLILTTNVKIFHWQTILFKSY